MKNLRLKNYLKFGILFFGVSLLTTNCEKDDQLTFDSTKNINAKTVTFDEAKVFFENKNSNVFAKRTSGNALILDPDWNSLEHSELTYTEAQLTKASTEVNRDGEFTSKLLFVNINGDIKSVILTTWVEDYNAQNNIVNANIYLNEYDGTFIDAYRIENGRFTKRLVPETNIQKANFFMLQEIFTPDCWNTDDLEGGELEAVDLGAISSGSGSYDGGNISGPENGPGIGDYGGYVDGGISGGNGYTGDDSIAPDGVDLGATTILMNPPIDPDGRGKCPPGYKKNPTTGKCDPICNGGKIYNTNSEECNCPDGKVEDDNGNCVDDCNTFDERIEDLFDTEGGYVNDPADPGGATNKGISWPVWKENASSILGVEPTLGNLQNLTADQAKLIYKSKYWNSIMADNIEDGDLRWLLFDFYVNAGGNAVKVLQNTLNQLGGNVSTDGVLGSQTLTAINSYDEKILLYNSLKANRQQYYDNITQNSINRYLTKNPYATDFELNKWTFKRFINGWTNRVNVFVDKTDENYLNVNC